MCPLPETLDVKRKRGFKFAETQFIETRVVALAGKLLKHTCRSPLIWITI